MTRPDITDLFAEFAPIIFYSAVVPIAIAGVSAAAYLLWEKHDLNQKSKVIYSHTKDSVTELLEKYHH